MPKCTEEPAIARRSRQTQGCNASSLTLCSAIAASLNHQYRGSPQAAAVDPSIRVAPAARTTGHHPSTLSDRRVGHERSEAIVVTSWSGKMVARFGVSPEPLGVRAAAGHPPPTARNQRAAEGLVWIATPSRGVLAGGFSSASASAQQVEQLVAGFALGRALIVEPVAGRFIEQQGDARARRSTCRGNGWSVQAEFVFGCARRSADRRLEDRRRGPGRIVDVIPMASSSPSSNVSGQAFGAR
jgi:hypothetical protein